jgi:Skp family chaperone for outer membrane proteins
MSDSQGRGRWPIVELIYVAGLAILLIYAIFFMNPHRVGVLDVARVARETGVLDRMQREERGLQDEARERLGKLQQAHIQKVNDLSRKLKNAVSEPEKTRIQGEIDSLQDAFQQSVTAARQNLQRHEAQMFATFRKRLMPQVEKVAHKRRLDIVLDPATTVLITKKTPDITADVVAAARDVFSPSQPLVDLSLIETRQPVGKWTGAADDQGEEPLAAPVQPEKARQGP